MSEQNFISYSPNPVVDYLIIHDADLRISNVVIYDLFGRPVYSGKEKTIDMIHIPAGTYTLNVWLNNGQRASAIIIKL